MCVYVFCDKNFIVININEMRPTPKCYIFVTYVVYHPSLHPLI